MNNDLNDAIVRLNPNNDFQMKDALGACIHVHWGDLWITQEGDLKDHIVKTGESFAINRPGVTLLNAMNNVGASIMNKCTESDLASAATIGSLVSSPPAASDESVSLRTHDRDDSENLAAGSGSPQFETEDLRRHLALAKSIRAHFVAEAINRVWHALRRSMGAVREFG